MKNILPVYSLGGTTDSNPPPGSFGDPHADVASAFVERRLKRGHSHRGRRRYRGLLFMGKSLYVRGASGHVYHERFLRTKHRSKIIQRFYSL